MNKEKAKEPRLFFSPSDGNVSIRKAVRRRKRANLSATFKEQRE